MEVIKMMLQQRGIPVDTVEPIENTSSFSGTIVKIGKVLIYTSNRARITEREIDTVLTVTEQNGGELSIILVQLPPSSTILGMIRQHCEKIQLFHIGQLQFDITTHRKVPPHRILNAEERSAFLTKYHIQDPVTQMPMIDSQDMMARWIGAKPGDIVEIIRKSETSGSTPYYRLCVADVTL
jgi:DNA-directed RNA polymerase I, II, and III subunit RPABC1